MSTWWWTIWAALAGVWREADYGTTDWETVITDLLAGEYKNPIGVIALNSAEGWARDMSADAAVEIRKRCDLQQRDVPSSRSPVGRSRAAAALLAPCPWCNLPDEDGEARECRPVSKSMSMKTAGRTDRKRAGDQLAGEDVGWAGPVRATRTQDYKSNRAASFLQIHNFGAVSYVPTLIFVPGMKPKSP